MIDSWFEKGSKWCVCEKNWILRKRFSVPRSLMLLEKRRRADLRFSSYFLGSFHKLWNSFFQSRSPSRFSSKILQIPPLGSLVRDKSTDSLPAFGAIHILRKTAVGVKKRHHIYKSYNINIPNFQIPAKKARWRRLVHEREKIIYNLSFHKNSLIHKI